MTGCPALASGPELGLAQALTNIDCRTAEAASGVFGRLFGPDGHLLPALTILLTLYVALFAVALLGGRTRLGINTLTPRMMTLGLVLTFATSWAAYQNVVWSLATGAPDEIAQVIAGTNGSATVAFADRLDGLFAAVADSADEASKPAPATDTGVTPATPMVGGFTASTVLWLSALMLLLGSVGVLVTCKIALAALLACGPVFIVFALFPGTPRPVRRLAQGRRHAGPCAAARGADRRRRDCRSGAHCRGARPIGRGAVEPPRRHDVRRLRRLRRPDDHGVEDRGHARRRVATAGLGAAATAARRVHSHARRRQRMRLFRRESASEFAACRRTHQRHRRGRTAEDDDCRVPRRRR